MKKFTFILLILLSAACERQLNVDFSKEKPLIVMYSVVEPGKPISVSVGKSFSFLDTDSNSAYLKDAAVELHINGKFVEKMKLERIDSVSQSSRKGTSHFVSTAPARIGDRIRIEASAPGLETAWAETAIPEPPSIKKVDTISYFTIIKEQGSNNYFGYYDQYYRYEELKREPFLRMMRLKIEVERANNDADQYYFLNLSLAMPPGSPYPRRGLFTGTKDDPIFGNDPKNSIFDALFEKNHSYSGSIFFSDKGFKNNTYTLNVSTYGFYEVDIEYNEDEDGIPTGYKSHKVENLPIEIRISSLSPDWHAYLKSKQEGSYDTDGMGFISEPKTTHTNVHNGIGFLGTMSHAYKQIDTPPFTGKENEIPQ